jgi:hypothetical protein
MTESRSDTAAEVVAIQNAPEIVPSLHDISASADPAVAAVAGEPGTQADAQADTQAWAATAGMAIVGVLGVTSVVAAVLGAMAFSQLRAVKADVASSREELMLAQERTTKLERQLDKALHSLEQQAQLVRAAEHTASVREGSEKAAIKLSTDEIQLIRSYIKASPVTVETTGTVGVGEELRDTRMLPLPSQIAAKSPRLAGGRFKIDRNGAIVISLRKSKQVDAVILPN